MIYIKNATALNKTYLGQTILPGEYFLIPLEEEKLFSQEDSLLTDIGNSDAVISKTNDGTTDISIVSDAIMFLQGSLPSKVENTSFPFAKKILSNGKKLYRRKHGVRKNCLASSDTFIDIIVPYVQCKIDEVEIINCSGNDNVDFLILDTGTNTYSQAPVAAVGANYILNQFGFNVAVSDLFYSDSSNYDADLYQGMIVRVIYKNTESQDKNIGINFVLHEVK